MAEQNAPRKGEEKSTKQAPDNGQPLDRLRALVEHERSLGGKPLRLHVILNPASGQDQPVLKLLNEALAIAEAEWDIFITKKSGDAARFARQAVEAGMDRLLVYGGDGTVMEAASGLIGSMVPLAILPGGTANVISIEMGIPGDLASACALAVHPAPRIIAADMGQAGERYFLLRAGTGLEAAMVENADREMKNKLGVFAYAITALQSLANPPVASYRLTLDGRQQEETEGVTCVVANSGATGLGPALRLAPDIHINDGLLDVLILRKADLAGLVSAAASVIGKTDPAEVLHWQAREVTIEADPPQTVQVDGEPGGETPVTIKVIPEAVRVVTPPEEGLG